MSGQMEIERKYLIAMPDCEFLRAQPGCAEWEIEQIYLAGGDEFQTRRIRRVIQGGEARYYFTEKRRVSTLTADETERLITRAEYDVLRAEADPIRHPLYKTRFRIPHAGHTLEIDVYPFWTGQAILEIELESESEIPAIPSYLTVLRDVSADPAYKNSRLSLTGGTFA